MKSLLIISALGITLLSCGGDKLSSGTEKTSSNEKTNSSNDTQKKSVVIGTQTWMAENLNVDKFKNGDPIPEAKSVEEWTKAGKEGKPAWCYYDNDPKNGEKYGKLYNWYAVNDPRGLAPAGWHVPSDKEWTVLSDYLGGNEVAGKKMKSTNGWNENGNGDNSSGFSGLPGGYRFESGGFGGNIGYSCYWWSITEDNLISALSRDLYKDLNDFNTFYTPKGVGLSVRCLKD
jgi:uncharacterized protein (TIGR02145 family)